TQGGVDRREPSPRDPLAAPEPAVGQSRLFWQPPLLEDQRLSRKGRQDPDRLAPARLTQSQERTRYEPQTFESLRIPCHREQGDRTAFQRPLLLYGRSRGVCLQTLPNAALPLRTQILVGMRLAQLRRRDSGRRRAPAG